ncbi:energy transducer TonB [Paracidobacterium acidisoli]|uniref:TonB C-terminal domain-containing protein n=1 Tax=Paracidobacterium acidisoli TaxID=2303751 RepID=A0A372ITM6_9BACT|nr:energy transducer TonB [Paracidobacterium acidisoli]MBT9329713.1 energy transducer TonB [Paracidobacterium acidisoli]
MKNASLKSAWSTALILSFAGGATPRYIQAEPSAIAGAMGQAAPAQSYKLPQADITEQEIRQRLTGKQLFLRGLWLDDDLNFDARGDLMSHSPTGSFTLCAVEIQRVRLTKHTLELEGVRYGIHFLGESPWPEQATSYDRIRLTSKKKVLKISINRADVILPKQTPEEKAALKKQEKETGHISGVYSSAEAAADAAKEASANTPPPPPPPPPPPTPTPGASATTDQKVSEQPAGNVTVSSYDEASAMMRTALDRIFASSIDAQMIAAMPEYWRYFYQAQQDHKSIEPTDASIVRPGPGVQGPKIVHTVEPASNEYAQENEIAGIAIYKIILDPEGKPLGVAIYRPIGFGLDENAVDAIHKSTFTGATREGKPVTSVINLTVSFRIYSERTARIGSGEVRNISGNGSASSSPSPANTDQH